ncbi:PPOX class F420-dependent oxidoreductase [Streptomyces sp. NBC_01465]|uniref:PPOX class F420-dependent oxidoreductase n=1 Tax=Streptomyces sp. NBC_01465 TaxID=2903878 RepID=UPI002E36B417|nr:PPOX class F420-dependent oxidoreductase [Streptomyces sp. NBC_01465]
MSLIPASHVDLLERPLFGHLATIRPDGTPHVNPVWFEWDGERLWFTTTTDRFKYRNVAGNPHVSLSVNDPEQPYRYLEVRGVVDRTEPDPSTAGYLRLARRYGLDLDRPAGGADDNRVLIGLTPRHTTHQ